MPADDDLVLFVREALARGVGRERVQAVLASAGWSGRQVAEALGAFADVDFEVPVPRPRPYKSARETFVYVLMFSTLYISAYSLGSVLFELIDRALPRPGYVGSVYSVYALRWAIASLIVSAPVFAAVAFRIARAVRLDPTRRLSRIRRQLTYVTLFFASCLLIGDVTTLVYYLLAGDTPLRFLLKVLVIAAIAGGAFAYYLGDLRDEESQPVRQA